MDYPQTFTDQSGGMIWCGLLGNIIASGTTLCQSQLARYQNTAPFHQSPRWQTQSPVWLGMPSTTTHKTTHLLLAECQENQS